MKRYWVYLKYLLRHKWHVYWACKKLDVPFLIRFFHDWDKFLPHMFVTYAKFFYEPDGSDKQKRGEFGYFKPEDTGVMEFEYCILAHIRRNKHHWQYWTTPSIAYRIPDVYVREMVADWMGAQKAQGYKQNMLLKWYNLNKDKLILHQQTRVDVEQLVYQYG